MDKKELEQKGNKFLAEMKALKDEKGEKYEFLESIEYFLKKAVKVANFKQIQKGLKDNFQKDISVSTIKRFCVDKGFYKPKAIAKKPKGSEISAPNDKPSVENTTAKDLAESTQKIETDKPQEQEPTLQKENGIMSKIFGKNNVD